MHSNPLRCGEGNGTCGGRQRLADWFGNGNGENGSVRIGVTRTEGVERLDIGVMGDEDHIDVGRDVPREVGGLSDAVFLVGRLGYG
jgi:hypothetical protein